MTEVGWMEGRDGRPTAFAGDTVLKIYKSQYETKGFYVRFGEKGGGKWENSQTFHTEEEAKEWAENPERPWFNTVGVVDVAEQRAVRSRDALRIQAERVHDTLKQLEDALRRLMAMIG